MYRTVLVPLDGSPLAESAVAHATLLAHKSAMRLILLRVVPVPAIPNAEAFEDQTETREEATAYLAGLAARLTKNGSQLQVETAVVDGDAAATLLEQARARQADLLVMATHGRSGIGRWLYGSVADDVLRHATIPVFLVPATGQHTWPADRAPRVLIPLDGSELAQEAINPASELATSVGADLVLLRVVEVPTYPMGPFGESYAYTAYDPAGDLIEAKQYLEGVAQTLRGRGHTVTLVTEIGFPSQEIAAVAQHQHVDVVAMATHGRSGLARLVLGSVATGTLQRAHVPLLLVRPAALHQPVAE